MNRDQRAGAPRQDRPHPAFEDNYIWCLRHEHALAVVDPGDATPVLRHLAESGERLAAILVTHPNAPNKMLMTSLMGWIAFDAFDLVDPLLTQPLMICAGSEADSLWQSQELYAKAPGSSKELFIIERASHMGLYDGSGREAVLGKITPFFRANL